MTIKTNPSPLPWHVTDEPREGTYGVMVCDEIHGVVAEAFPNLNNNADANAALIVAAVNSHAALLAQVAALDKINAIRNSIIGLQKISWSEHIYPLVAALNDAGIVGLDYQEATANVGTLLTRAVSAEAERDALRADNARLLAGKVELGGIMDANAALIVTAVNAHAALVAQVEALTADNARLRAAAAATNPPAHLQ